MRQLRWEVQNFRDNGPCPSVTKSIEEFVPALPQKHPESRPERLVILEY